MTTPKPELPDTVYIEMSLFPAWMWEVCDPDGKCVKRFKSNDTLRHWMTRNGYWADAPKLIKVERPATHSPSADLAAILETLDPTR